MLHIKLNAATCKHIFCPYTHPRPHGVRSKVKTFFLKVVMLHIKLMGTEHRAPCKHRFCPYVHPRPLGWVKRSKHFLLKVVMLHFKLKAMEHRAPCKHICHAYTHPHPVGRVKGNSQRASNTFNQVVEAKKFEGVFLCRKVC